VAGALVGNILPRLWGVDELLRTEEIDRDMPIARMGGVVDGVMDRTPPMHAELRTRERRAQRATATATDGHTGVNRDDARVFLQISMNDTRRKYTGENR